MRQTQTSQKSILKKGVERRDATDFTLDYRISNYASPSIGCYYNRSRRIVGRRSRPVCVYVYVFRVFLTTV
jgi:hypothetical protein